MTIDTSPAIPCDPPDATNVLVFRIFSYTGATYAASANLERQTVRVRRRDQKSKSWTLLSSAEVGGFLLAQVEKTLDLV